MTTLESLRTATTQSAFGELVGISQAAVADLVRRGVLRPGDSLGEWLRAYCEHLRAVAAGRIEAPGIVAERERLLRARAIAAERDNATATGELVSRRGVAQAAAGAAREVVNRLEQLPDRLAPTLVGKTVAQAAGLLRVAIDEVRTQVADLIERGAL